MLTSEMYRIDRSVDDDHVAEITVEMVYLNNNDANAADAMFYILN